MKRLSLLFIILLFLTACTSSNASTDDGSLQVVATYSILGDFVQQVGGNHITVTTLVGPGGDAHTFEPSPADSTKLAEADLIFENGLEFETWLDDLYTSSASEAERVVVTDGIEPLAMEEGHEHDEEHADEEHTDEEHADEEHADEEHADEEHTDEEHADEEHADEEHTDEEHAHEEHAHEHGEFDPHVWHDVTLAIHMVEQVRDALVETDPDNAVAYQDNAEAYLDELAELDNWVKEQVATIPIAERKLVTTHDTFGYFAAQYGFEVVGTAVSSFTTEAADPSAAEMAELVEDIKAAGVPVIFAENIANPRLIEQIASEAGVTVAATLYTDALGEPGSDGDTYIKMVRYNVSTMVTALQG